MWKPFLQFVFLCCLTSCGTPSWVAHAEDWPRWRGPRADGTWNAPPLETAWPEEGLATVWKQSIGGGYSGVTVADGLVYVQDRQTEPQEIERVLCFDAKTGTPVFAHTYEVKYDAGKDRRIDYPNGPRAAPTIHEGKVYTLGAVGDLRCLNAQTGELLWKSNLIEDLNGRLSMWGYSASPFIFRDFVIVQPGGADGWHVVALDKQTGQIQWRSLDDEAGYATPVLCEHQGAPLLILWTPSHIRGINPQDGTPYWEYPYEITYGVSIADPIQFEDLILVCGYWDGSKAIRLGETPTEASLGWEDKRWLRGLMSQPLQQDGYGYLLDKSYGLTCFKLRTGEKLWDDAHQLTPRGRNPQASLVWLNGTNRALALNSDGDLVLTELTPEKSTELARHNMIDKTWAHPAYAGDKVFARSDSQLVCVQLPVRERPRKNSPATSAAPSVPPNTKSAPTAWPATTPAARQRGALRVGVFDVEISPPLGTPVAYAPARSIADPISARGVVLLGDERPVVLCAVDFIGIANTSHREWREKLAEAAGTDADRVTVHALHQHDAPRCDFLTAELIDDDELRGGRFDVAYSRDVIRRVADAVRTSREDARPVTHLGLGTAEVEKVASNRRILGEDGKVKIIRWSKSNDPAAIAAPEGVIDPELSLLAFFAEETPVAALTWYATHPQSYYGQGDVTCEFVGLARNARSEKTLSLHVHFNGAGGNVAAGKYNDGSVERRAILAERMEAGMRKAWENVKKVPVFADDLEWRSTPVKLPPGKHLVKEQLLPIVKNPQADKAQRLGAASHLAFLLRCEAGDTIDLTCLRIGNAYLVGMPGELFVEYQLAAKRMRPDDFVAMAAYGDYGPGYIGTEVAYSQGGYETSDRASRVAPEVERVLMEGLRKLLQP
jgi:outer membrane protein assembly factor BamB